MARDMIGREIKEEDYVVYYNNLYEVIKTIPNIYGKSRNPNRQFTRVSIKLLDPSRTTKSVKKWDHEVCIVPKDEVLIWLLTRPFKD